MKLTDEQLREIAERAEKATPGPWNTGDEGDFIAIKNKDETVAMVDNGFAWAYDLDFIVDSRTDIPALLAHIKALEEENRRFVTSLQEIALVKQCCGCADDHVIMQEIARKALKGNK